ncbi:T9SS type A sorting domain-containing protein [uncultured Barnesiella sp.]|nr:T9SS type A sorting domain-containing protein [uncultured Barnesiella sp.]
MLSIDNIGFYGDIVKGGSSVESVAADGRLWVSAGQVVCSAEQVDRIVVFDASGRQVAGCENQSTLDVDHLSSGVYLVRAMADGQVLQTKFIK